MDKFDLLHARLDRLEKKIDQLLAFKFTIYGAICILPVVTSVGIGLYFNK